jgi:hypothetical protein
MLQFLVIDLIHPNMFLSVLKLISIKTISYAFSFLFFLEKNVILEVLYVPVISENKT